MTLKCFTGYFVSLTACSVAAFSCLCTAPASTDDAGAANVATKQTAVPHVRHMHRLPVRQLVERGLPPRIVA